MIKNIITKKSLSQTDSSLDPIGTFVGIALIVIGGYLPWLKNNPDFTGNALVLMPELTIGFSRFDLVFIIPIVVVLLVIVFQGFSKTAGVILLLCGAVVTTIPLLLAVSVIVETNPVYVPTLGAILSISGGMCFIAIGARIVYYE